MQTIHKVTILCLLNKAKEDKRFYQKNSKEINRCIKVVKDSIDLEKKPNNSLKRKIDPLTIKDYAVAVINLIAAYFKRDSS